MRVRLTVEYDVDIDHVPDAAELDQWMAQWPENVGPELVKLAKEKGR